VGSTGGKPVGASRPFLVAAEFELSPDFPQQPFKLRGGIVHFSVAGLTQLPAMGFERGDQLKCLTESRGTSVAHRSPSEAQREQSSSSDGFFLLTAKFLDGYLGQSS
jgi:hypothetical protein